MRKALILTALAALLLPTLAMAQAQITGMVTGRVLDEDRNPIVGAVVTLSGPALPGERSMETRADGRFIASLLPVGNYTAVVSAPGRQAAVLEFRVGVGETVPLEVTLLPGEDFAETITVTGRLSPLEQTEGGGRFDYETDVEELPLGFTRRNINLVAFLAPNTSFGPNVGQVSFAGAPAFDMIVLLDGAEISDPYFGAGTVVYIEDAIQEVQVLTTSVSARYGRTQGGVINAITKSGGNEFSGSLRAEFDKESWNSQTPFGESQSDTLNEIYQATLGGFFMRDRLWFFGGYRTIPDTSFTITPLVGAGVTSTTEQDRYQIKLRGAITPNHTLDFSYLEFDQTNSPHAGLPAGDLNALGNREDPREMYSAVYQGVVGPSTFLDVHVTEKNVSIASGGDPAGMHPMMQRQLFRVFNNHWWDFTDPTVRDNRTAAANLTHAFDTATFGSHLFEGGVQWVESKTAGDNRQSPTGMNFDNHDARSFVGSTGPGGTALWNVYGADGALGDPGLYIRWVSTNLRAENEVENVGLYVQDSITWQDFRFDLGVRWDRFRGTTTGVQAFDMTFNDISPRLAVTYNMTPSWQVMGSWAKYVGRFNDAWGEQASGVSSAPRSVYQYVGPSFEGLTSPEMADLLEIEAYWNLINIVASPEFPTTFMTAEVESPFAEEFVLSVRHALPRNAGHMTLSFTNRDYRKLMTGFTGLVCTDWNLNFDLPCPGGDFVTIPGVGGAPDTLIDTTVWGNDARARRDYQGLAMTFDYRPTLRFTLGGNWTWSRTRGTHEGEATNQPAYGATPLGTRERAWPLEAGAPYGFLNPHIRHRASAWATQRFDFDRFGRLSTSLVANYRTGRVWSRMASVPYASVPEYASDVGSYTHFFDGRGNNEFNSLWGLDFAVRHAVPVWRHVDLWVKADVINILNRDRLISHLTTGTWVWSDSGTTTPGTDSNRFRVWAPAGSFGVIDGPSRYQTPRTYLFSVGVQF